MIYFCRPDAGSNASRQQLSSNISHSNKLSGNRSSSSSGPSSPQNIDFTQNDLSNSSAMIANESKQFHQKPYPVVYGELVILGFGFSLFLQNS